MTDPARATPAAMSPTPPRVHIIGQKNAGKTTLVCDLVAALAHLGLRVATIKHTHHQHELDTPGKDSHRHRTAGACAVGILSPAVAAAFVPHRRDDPAREPYALFASLFQHADLILVEGDRFADALRLEVWRAALGTPPYACTDPHIHALITDDTAVVPCPVWPRTPLGALAERITTLVPPQGMT